MTINFREGKKYYQWRDAVYKRDNYCCQICKAKEDLVPHHVLEWDEHPELRLDITNGLTLCRSCHISHHMKNNKLREGKTPWNKGLTGLSTGVKKGTKFSKEHKAKLSLVKKNNPAASQRCIEMANKRKGKPLSPEHRAKLAEKTKIYWDKKRKEAK